MTETAEDRFRKLYTAADVAEMTKNAVHFAASSGATQVAVNETGEIRDASKEHFGLKDDGTELDVKD